MNVSAKLTRAADKVSVLSAVAGFAGVVVTASLISACSYIGTGEDTSMPQADAATEIAATDPSLVPADAATTADLAAQIPDSAGASRMLVSQSASSPGLELIEGESFNRLLIHAPLQEGDYKVSRYSSPDRVVIDLLSSGSRLNRVFNTEDAGIVSKVRVGAHPDRSRIVLDLNGEAGLVQTASLTNDGLAVTVTSPASLAAARSATETASVAKIDTDEPALIPAAVPLAETDRIDSNVAPQREPEASVRDEEPSMKAMPVAFNPESQPLVKGLSLETLPGSENALIADVDAAGFYTLKRTAPSEYVLKIEGAALGSDASTTILAPPMSGSIRSVRPLAQGGDVLLRIFTAPGTILNATVRAGKIVVSSNDSSVEESMRAQFAPEKAGEADTTGKPAAPAAEKSKEAESIVAGSKPNPGSSDDGAASLLQENPKYVGRLISLDLQDTDIDNALRIIAEVSNLNIIASDDVTGKVTLRLIDVPWDQALDVILKTNGLDKVQEGNVVRIAPVEKLRQEREALKQAQQAEEELEVLSVKYIRVSYGKASELKPLVETVLSERGTVTYDERTNQLIVKDIHKGIRNVAELVSKIDLRTPQVLLETQIVEAKRNFLRDLGSQLGFSFIRSPATGNATGWNFPNSISVGGAVPGAPDGTAVSFPAAVNANQGSALNFLFGSADGSKTLEATITALEQDGRIRVVSRPAVATTNNKPALIKSVEKIRVKTPSGGTSVATGQGASASGSSGVATEVIEIGIQLDVTPQASPDYFVLLDVKAKSSTFGSRIVDGIPSEVERSANSTVLVSSGQTFAMGGIYKVDDKTTATGVPFFKDIPFFGHLFRDTLVDNSDEELLFFITPRIIEGSFDDAAMKSST